MPISNICIGVFKGKAIYLFRSKISMSISVSLTHSHAPIMGCGLDKYWHRRYVLIQRNHKGKSMQRLFMLYSSNREENKRELLKGLFEMSSFVT